MPPLPSETTTSAPEVIEVETEVIEAVEVAESEAAFAETSETREGTTSPPEEKPEGGVPPEPPAPAEQAPPPTVEVHRQAAPPTPGPSTAAPIRKNHLPWVIAAVVVVIALVAGGSFWVLSSRASQARAAEMDTALNGLRSSISSAERSLERARSAVDALAEQAAAKDDTTVQALAAKADAAIIEFAETLDGAREMLSSAQAQGPTADAAVKVQEAAAALEDLAEQLDEVTGSVEDAVDELQAAPREMNLAQIAKGDYSSIGGTWTSATVTSDDINHQSLEIEGSTIDWTAFDGPFGRVEGLEFVPLRPVDDGDAYTSEVILNTSDAVTIQWIAHLDEFDTDIGNMLVFYPAGAKAIVPFTDKFVTSDESVARIMALPTNGGGRMYVNDASLFLMTKIGSASEEPTEEAATTPAACVAPVEGAYPCAGGPIPEGAKPLTVSRVDIGGGTDVAKLETPSENIVCSVQAKEVICLVRSWDPAMTQMYNEHSSGGTAAAYLKQEGEATTGAPSEMPIGLNAPVTSTLLYGTVWYFGDFVFASEEAGLTFWNVTSGYGAMINRSGFYPFGPK